MKDEGILEYAEPYLRAVAKELHQRPIAFYPAYAKLSGSLAGGVLLSQIMYWWQGNGKFYKSDAELREECALTEREFKRAKAAVKNLPFVTVTLEGVPATTYYEIDVKAYAQVMLELQETSEPVRTPSSELDWTPSSELYIGTEITTENTEDNNANALFPGATNSHPNGSEPVASGWPDSDRWLLGYLETQTILTIIDLPLDHRWWDSVSIACSGISESFLDVQFAKMQSWLIENPARKPTPRGVRRFVRTWLERAHEKERRFNGKT